MQLASSTGMTTLVSIALLAWAERAIAIPLTFYFEGYVTLIHDFLELDESVYVGATFSGGYTFDPNGVVDLYPNNQNVKSYYFGPAGRIWAQIGNYDFATDDLGILIWNNLLNEDLYEPISFSVSDTAGYQWSIMRLVLGDRPGDALASDVLPLTTPDLSAFGTARNLLLHLPGDDVGIGGVLTSLTPEPGSLLLFGIGSLGFCLRRGR